MTLASSPSTPATDDRQPAGEIHVGRLYTAVAFRRRLGWGLKAYRHAKRKGLRVSQFGRQEFVMGADVLAFFQRLAEEQQQEATT